MNDISKDLTLISVIQNLGRSVKSETGLSSITKSSKTVRGLRKSLTWTVSWSKSSSLNFASLIIQNRLITNNKTRAFRFFLAPQ